MLIWVICVYFVFQIQNGDFKMCMSTFSDLDVWEYRKFWCLPSVCQISRLICITVKYARYVAVSVDYVGFLGRICFDHIAGRLDNTDMIGCTLVNTHIKYDNWSVFKYVLILFFQKPEGRGDFTSDNWQDWVDTSTYQTTNWRTDR